MWSVKVAWACQLELPPVTVAAMTEVASEPGNWSSNPTRAGCSALWIESANDIWSAEGNLCRWRADAGCVRQGHRRREGHQPKDAGRQRQRRRPFTGPHFVVLQVMPA